MASRLTSSSNGRGPALSALVAEWAERNPKVRRVWTSERGDDAVAISLELQPVPDSEETFAVWIANCEKWRVELQDRIGRSVDLEWLDPDDGARVNTLIYERGGWQ